MPVDRLLELLNLLRARPQSTAGALADELGVSVRTVYRYVDALRGTGVPIAGEAGVGYRLRPGFELPPLTFDAEELAALVTGARMVFRYADPDLGAAARRALHKLEAALPPDAAAVVRRTALFVPAVDEDGVHVVAPVREAPTWVSELRHALDGRRKVHLEYADGDGAWSERVVRPVGLFFWGRVWSVGAWCELRRDWRSFRADRIRDLHVADDVWSESDGHTVEAFLTAMRSRPRR
jgi:predicted DNA-binding transcriptional regulator YafY